MSARATLDATRAAPIGGGAAAWGRPGGAGLALSGLALAWRRPPGPSVFETSTLEVLKLDVEKFDSVEFDSRSLNLRLRVELTPGSSGFDSEFFNSGLKVPVDLYLLEGR